METDVTELNVENGNSFFKSSKGLIIFIFVVLIIGGIVSFSVSQKEKIPRDAKPTEEPANLQSSKMIVYGVWKDNKSYIKAFDTGLKKEYIITTLPINIKKVKILSPAKLLYIGNTDSKDHGENLSIYDLSYKMSKVVYIPEDGFKIDDYVISKNKQYAATWEVSFKEGSSVLSGGRSRVSAINLSSPVIKNLIYDELATKDYPVHYPRAILSDGTLFLDTFLPNSGAGWSYGMSASNFDGTKKQDLDNMKNGTYGTQPSISKDEDFLVFSGYSTSDGATLENGFRKAILSPNTIELLNTKNKERVKLNNISSDNIYSSSYFDEQTGNIILSLISKDTAGTYSYNLKTNSLVKISTSNNTFISYITTDNILTGNKSQTVSSLGNLGDSYSSPYSNFSILNKQTNQTTPVKLTDNFMQFISIASPNFFGNMEEIDTLSDKTLQLQTFNFKPSLAPKRETQQSMPVNPSQEVTPPACPDMRYSQCSRRFTAGTPEFGNCMETTPSGCYDSPLYLYSKPGTKVNVKVNTYIYSSDPVYDSKTGYNVKLLDDGRMEVNGKIYDRINYDYLSKEISPPEYGIVTTKEKLKETLTYYSQNLGLNTKETDDLIKYAISNIKSPYVFVSFFDDKTSKEILPLEFKPSPDIYINVVFYFKEYDKKPSINPQPPIFGSIPDRKGFTAVEISEILN